MAPGGSSIVLPSSPYIGRITPTDSRIANKTPYNERKKNNYRRYSIWTKYKKKFKSLYSDDIRFRKKSVYFLAHPARRTRRWRTWRWRTWERGQMVWEAPWSRSRRETRRRGTRKCWRCRSEWCRCILGQCWKKKQRGQNRKFNKLESRFPVPSVVPR